MPSVNRIDFYSFILVWPLFSGSPTRHQSDQTGLDVLFTLIQIAFPRGCAANIVIPVVLLAPPRLPGEAAPLLFPLSLQPKPRVGHPGRAESKGGAQQGSVALPSQPGTAQGSSEG